MQEANDKTQLKRKKAAPILETNPGFFYPVFGLAGVASAFAFYRAACE